MEILFVVINHMQFARFNHVIVTSFNHIIYFFGNTPYVDHSLCDVPEVLCNTILSILTVTFVCLVVNIFLRCDFINHIFRPCAFRYVRLIEK